MYFQNYNHLIIDKQRRNNEEYVDISSHNYAEKKKCEKEIPETFHEQYQHSLSQITTPNVTVRDEN